MTLPSSIAFPSWEHMDCEYFNGPDEELDEAAVLVKKYLQPGSDLGPSQAALQIHKALAEIEPQGLRRGFSDDLDLFYYAINEAARHIPYDHPLQIRLLELLLEMRGSDRATAVIDWVSILFGLADEVADKSEDQDGSAKFRIPLGAYGQNVRDHYGLDDDPEGRRQWVNEHAFYSRVHASGSTNLLLFFRWQMQEVFLHEASNPVPKGETLDCHLAACALWVINAGAGILQDLVGSTKALKGAVGGDSRKDPDKNLSLGHWRVWRAGFRQYEKDESVAEEPRRLSKNAADLMDVLGRMYGIVESKDECSDLSTIVRTS